LEFMHANYSQTSANARGRSRLKRVRHQQTFFTLPQFATSSWGGRRKLPLAFTEHGAIMAATVLETPRAVEVSVYVVRAFVQLRDLLAGNKELARRLVDLERRLTRKLADHDQAIANILDAIRQLMTPPDPPKRPIGFVTLKEKKSSS